jgi:hypothetical protein
MVWRTAIILTNIPAKFHRDEHEAASQIETFPPLASRESV